MRIQAHAIKPRPSTVAYLFIFLVKKRGWIIQSDVASFKSDFLKSEISSAVFPLANAVTTTRNNVIHKLATSRHKNTSQIRSSS